MFQKELGYLKKETKKEERKERGQMSHSEKKRFSKPKFSSNSSSLLREVYKKISQRS
jgi:hypothetical protein